MIWLLKLMWGERGEHSFQARIPHLPRTCDLYLMPFYSTSDNKGSLAYPLSSICVRIARSAYIKVKYHISPWTVMMSPARLRYSFYSKRKMQYFKTVLALKCILLTFVVTVSDFSRTDTPRFMPKLMFVFSKTWTKAKILISRVTSPQIQNCRSRQRSV